MDSEERGKASDASIVTVGAGGGGGREGPGGTRRVGERERGEAVAPAQADPDWGARLNPPGRQPLLDFLVQMNVCSQLSRLEQPECSGLNL